MTGVRVLVGTRKGAFVLTADGTREDWDGRRPALRRLGGLPPHRLPGRPGPVWTRRRPAAGSARSSSAPTTAARPGSRSATTSPTPASPARTSGTTARRSRGSSSGSGTSSRRRTDPDTVYAGVEDAALFRSADGGGSWTELTGLRDHGSGPQWQPGAGGMCLHTILLDPDRPGADLRRDLGGRGVPRPTTPGETWQPINQRADVRRASRTRTPRSATACTSIARHPARPDTLFMQKHWDVMRSDDAGGHLARGQRQPADATSASRSTCTRTSRRRSTSCRSPATPSTTRRTASCGSTAAGPAATSGSR